MEGRGNAFRLRHMHICRFCLSSDGNLTNIYETQNNKKNLVPLPLQIMACVAIEVFQNDGMPQLICQDCKKLAVQGYNFKVNCKKADDALKLFLATGNLVKPSSGSNIEQEHRAKENVKIRKVAEPMQPQPQPIMKKIKIETDSEASQEAPDLDSQYEEHALEEYEICPGSNNEFNVKLVTPASKQAKPAPQVQCVKTECFNCPECEKSFPLKQLLDMHLENRHSDDLSSHIDKKHNKKRPFTCEECGKSFVFKQGLERHALVHNEDKPHKCNYCEASFSSPIKLTRHVTSHAGLRPYPCKLCKRTFLLSHHLTRHMRSHYAAKTNNVQQIGQHKCDICSMSFRRKDSLINHSAIHSMVNLRCVICYTKFSNANAVKEHITTHLSGLPFPCEKCDYSFESKDQLEDHEVKHAEMEYEEQIEKEVVEEARVQGHIKEDPDVDGEDYDEFEGDRMGGNGEDDDDYVMDEEDSSQMSMFSNSHLNEDGVRRSQRVSKGKKYADFFKNDIDFEIQEEEDNQEEEDDEQRHQTADAEQSAQQNEPTEVIKPIFRMEGTKVYKGKAQNKKPKIIPVIPSDKIKTAPLSQINQPKVTTIENLGLTTKDLQNLPTEKYVNMRIGNKTVRVQKLVLTKKEVKAMAKEGKFRGNTVLIKNPGHISNINPVAFTLDKLKHSAEQKPGTSDSVINNTSSQQETCNASIVGRDSVIINDMIINNVNLEENIDERVETNKSIDL